MFLFGAHRECFPVSIFDNDGMTVPVAPPTSNESSKFGHAGLFGIQNIAIGDATVNMRNRFAGIDQGALSASEGVGDGPNCGTAASINYCIPPGYMRRALRVMRLGVGRYLYSFKLRVSEYVGSRRFASILKVNNRYWNQRIGRYVINLLDFRFGLSKYQPSPNASNGSVGAFLSRLSCFSQFTRLVSSENSIKNDSDESDELYNKSWFTKFAFEFVVEFALLLLGIAFLAVGWWLVRWEHETVSQVLPGVALMAASYAF